MVHLAMKHTPPPFPILEKEDRDEEETVEEVDVMRPPTSGQQEMLTTLWGSCLSGTNVTSGMGPIGTLFGET